MAPGLNLAALQESVGGPSVLRAIVGAYLSDTELRLQEMQTAACAGDQGRVRFVAHAARGAARYFDLDQLVAACATAEHTEFHGDAASLMHAVDQVQLAFTHAQQALQAWLAGTDPA